VRGLCIQVVQVVAWQGSTPARAGIIPRMCWTNTARWEHPRACGDYQEVPAGALGSLGAPPRVRGLYDNREKQKREKRSTPARAGIINQLHVADPAWEEHPRACGDYVQPLILSLSALGAPPRVRGLSGHHRARAPGRGSIPARAGIICALPGTPAPVWEHPRACGDYRRCEEEKMLKVGAPPRVRGLFHRREPRGGRFGSTPARAGIILQWLQVCRTEWEHPRACGDYL